MANQDIVTTRLAGGLCNYLFEIAAAYAYAIRNAKNAIFSLSDLVVIHKGYDQYKDNVLRNIKVVNIAFNGTFSTYAEPCFHFSELPYINGNLKLHGYFQSEKYFKDCKKDIIDLFSCPQELRDSLYAKYEDLLNHENTCAIHVRRGDYVKQPENHPTQDIIYYMKGIKQMPKDCKFLVFSDDIEWCKNSFPQMDNMHFIEGNKDYEDLYLMSFCKNQIIANSSFSWWAAYLNENENKKVVAPKNWFGYALNQQYSTKDLYCENWILI